MAVVVQDLVDQASLTQEKGYKVTRVFHVSGLTGNATTRLYNATLLPEIPAQGSAHPDIPGIYARSINVSPVESSSARVVVTYQPRDPATQPPDDNADPIVEVGAALVEVETNKDINGTFLVLGEFTVTEYNKTLLPKQIEETNTYPPQPGKITVQRPLPLFKFSRRETESPYSKSLNYVGNVNSDSFLGYAAGYWLCSRIYGRSDDGGESYNVEYEFLFNRETWKPWIAATHPDTGEPPVNLNGTSALVEGTSLKQIVVYLTISFSGLNL